MCSKWGMDIGDIHGSYCLSVVNTVGHISICRIIMLILINDAGLERRLVEVVSYDLSNYTYIVLQKHSVRYGCCFSAN